MLITISFYDAVIILYFEKAILNCSWCPVLESVKCEEPAKSEPPSRGNFGILEILVGDGKTGISIYTIGGGKTNDIDMSTGLVFALEQAIREHSGSAKDVFFGGINASGGISWCVKKFEVAGEPREFYIGAALIPGASYSLDIDTLEQKNKGKREFFVFLKDFLLPSIVKHLNNCIEKKREAGEEANLDAFLATGVSAFKRGEVNQLVKSSEELGDTWKVFSEACTKASKEQGLILRALYVDKKGFVDSRRICSEMISEYLEELYSAQNIKLDGAEWRIQRTLGPLKTGPDKSYDSWIKHIIFTGAEGLFTVNPSCPLLLADTRSYFNMWENVLKEKLREWGTRRKDFLIKMRYGANFLDSVGSKFGSVSREEVSEREEEILEFLSLSMMDKISEEFPLTALTYDFKKKSVIKNEMLEVIKEVIPVVEREVIAELFEKVKEEVFDTEKFTKEVFSRKKTETIRKKIDDWTNKLYRSLQEALYKRNIVFSLFPEPLEQFKAKIADFINEKAIVCLKDDIASAILLALKLLGQEIKDPEALVYLDFVRELVKGFVGKELNAIYPTLGYLLKEAQVLDKLDDAFKIIMKDTGYEDVKILENVSTEIKRVSERETAVNSSVEKALEAKSIIQEAIRKMLARGEGLGGILLGDEA